MKCDECGSKNVIKKGFNTTRKGQTQKYQCKDCGRIFQTKEEN